MTPDLRGEHEHVRTRIRLFQDEYRATSAPARRTELQQEMLRAARESAELVRRIEAGRLRAVLVHGGDAWEARYALETALADRLDGAHVSTYTDGPRGPDGAVLTAGELRRRGDPLKACIRQLAVQSRDMALSRSERRRTLIEAHGRERARAVIAEIMAFVEEIQTVK